MAANRIIIQRQVNLRKWFSDWSKFNILLYLKDFSFYKFCWLFIFSAIAVLFHIPLLKTANLFLVDTILATCSQNAGADIIFLLIAFFGIITFLRRLYNHLLPTFNSIIFGVIMIALYWIFIKSDNQYDFYHFSYLFTRFTYSTIFLLSILPLLFSYKPYMNPLIKEPSQLSLLEDSLSINTYEDILGRSEYANSIANHISHTSSSVSFAIGVVGEWGSGKSDFLHRLKSALEINSENIVFEFNPWRANRTDAIVENFFKEFSSAISPYNHSITGLIKQYSSQILKPAEETNLKIIDALIDGWLRDENIQAKYKSINKSIKAISKRIIVLIDDVDRLTGNEVMEVLRIIRNTANFSNTFFVVGIDQNYIVDVLRKTNGFSNEEEYLKKVFQLIITLPAFKKEKLVNEIKKYLFTPDLQSVDKEKITSSLKAFGLDSDTYGPELFLPSFDYESLLEKMLDNVRDLKRFCNSFKIVFQILKNEADIHDLIMLELIRNKNIDLYNRIRSRNFLTTHFDKPNQLALHQNAWDAFAKELPEKDRGVLREAVDFLFTDLPFKNQRKLLFPHNFYIYFSYQLFNLISFHEFNLILTKSTEEISLTFNRWIEEGNEKELYQIIINLDDFPDPDSLRKIIIVLLRIHRPGTYWFANAKRLIFDKWKQNHLHYFQSKMESHKEFIFSVLNDEPTDLFIRASLAFQLLNGLHTGLVEENEFVLNRKELRNLIYHLFDNYLISNPSDPNKTLEFFNLNDYRVEGEYAKRFPPACKRFKNYLLSNVEGFKGYIKTLLRPSQHPYNGKFVIEPLIEQVFPDWRIFEKKLLNTDFEDKDLNRLKEIILEYLTTYVDSGRKPFKILDQHDREFIERFLQINYR